MTSKRVMVTGGAGFIGSNLAAELVKRHDVLVIDDLSSGKIDNLANLHQYENFTFVRGSITDLDLLKHVFTGVDYIFHQAAIPSVHLSITNPMATNEANVNGTLRVLLAARDCGVNTVVFASSCAIYGDTAELPIREDQSPNPKSPYAVSKLVGEHYCKVFSDVYGLKTVCLRYFNVFGPRQDPASEYAAVIPKFITRMLTNQAPIIYGDGTQTRDFIFVKDVVHANIVASEHGKGVFNVASGISTSINELAETIGSMIGNNTKPVHDSPRAGEIKHSFADITKAREELKFEPEYGLDSGLQETIKYFGSLTNSLR